MVLAVAGLGGFDLQAGPVELKGSRPNIIFFLADDQSRFDHSAYGNPKAPTPETGKFATEGLVFDRAYTGQAICAPSRSMLYSGLYPIRNGCFINHTSIRPGVKTLAHYLEALDYTVILAGKSHVNPGEQFPWTKRFHPVKRDGLPRPSIPVEEMDRFLGDLGKNPFCIIVASEYPHGPYIKDGPFSADDIHLSPKFSPTDATFRRAKGYYASIAEKEKEFAAVLDLLDEHGLEQNTIVFYADDHGADLGKFTVTDTGLRVAFMVRWPGKIKPGRTEALTSFADFVPTVVELAGGDIPEGLDGKSLLPVLEGRSQTHHEYVYGVAHNQGIQRRSVFPQRSIHDGRYHYVFSFNSMERIERERAAGKPINYFLERGAQEHGLPEEQLFDTLEDPHEFNNLLARQNSASDGEAGSPEVSAIRARLKKELFRWMESQNDYLAEDAPVVFLETRMHRLDQPAAKFKYNVPEDYIGSLNGKLRDPHEITAPNP
jgi:uncharacterized sulfatase